LLFDIKRTGWNRAKTEINDTEIVFENLIETPFMNGKWGLVILFLAVMNDISHLISYIVSTAFKIGNCDFFNFHH
jgi:hypothetical protein